MSSSGLEGTTVPPREQVEIMGENIQVEFVGPGNENAQRRDSMKPPSIKKRDSDDSSPQFKPGEWEENVTDEKFQEVRIMMFDIRREEDKQLRNVSWEFFGPEGVRTAFRMGRDRNVLLRVYHIQNLTSTRSLEKILSKYDISATTVATQREATKSFANWVHQRQPRRLAGKPLLHAGAWKVQNDHVRGVTKVTFGFDYMKPYESDISLDLGGYESEDEAAETRRDARTFQLMAYDPDENPVPSTDLFPQRVSVLVQRRMRELRRYPLTKEEKERQDTMKLDNGNAIVIFDNANTLNAKDTLIPARSEIEDEWRKMPFRYDQEPAGWGDDKVVLSCMKSILNYIYYQNVAVWDELLDRSWEHYNIIEDQIYEQPADESRAPELWNSSALWLKYDKLMYFHKECFLDTKKNLGPVFRDEFANFMPFPTCVKEYDRLSNILQDDLTKPTANLSDLMYKSVGIRDSRHSIRLGNSMWRLSWVTFVFLPLTFITGFFGMNVGTFESNPDIKWYFIAAVPFMALVLVAWYALKEYFNRTERAALEREAFRNLISGLHLENQHLWTRTGPNHTAKPVGFWSRLRWKLVMYWTDGLIEERRPRNTNTWGDLEAQKKETKMTMWGRFKARLIRNWSRKIEIEQSEMQPLTSDENESEDNDQNEQISGVSRKNTFAAHEYSQTNPHGRSILTDPSAGREVTRSRSPSGFLSPDNRSYSGPGYGPGGYN